MVIIATIILLIVSFSAYAVIWTLQYHYESSIFRSLDPFFWNPKICWWGKYSGVFYKDGIAHYTPKFWGSTHIFVFVTDGPHLIQFIFLNSIFLALAINIEQYHWIINFIAIRIICGIVFNLFFDKILIKK